MGINASRARWPVLFAVVIAASFVLKLAVMGLNSGVWWDEAVYLGLSQNLRDGVYGLDGVESDRPPLFPVFLSLFGADIGTGRMIVWALSVLAVYLSYVMGREAYGRDAGLVTAALTASFPLYFFFTTKLLSEALFSVFFIASLICLNRSLRDGGRRSWVLVGVTTGLAFLTRYPATVLVIAYAAYGLYKGQSRGVAYFLASFAAVLVPWLAFSTLVYGSPWGAYAHNLGILAASQPEPWYYYAQNFFVITGLPGTLFAIALLVSLKQKRADFYLLLALAVFVVFSLPVHKELRHPVAFLPVVALASSRLLQILKPRNTQLFAVLAISVMGFASGANEVLQDSEGAVALVNSADFLRDKEGAVLSEYYDYKYPLSFGAKNPWLEVLGGKEVFILPSDEADIGPFLQQHPNVRYAVIYAFGPRVPEYAASYAQKHWTPVASFAQWGNESAAVVYDTRQPKPFYVSVTFDDGLASQYDAASVLDARGMRGTFYIASGLLGSSFEGIETMTVSQVVSLAQRGHEVGAHTYGHVNANNASAAAFEKEIIDDNAFFASRGIAVTSFAYPYGEVAHKETVEKHYTSGRNAIDRVNPVPVPDKIRYELYAVPVSSNDFEKVEQYLGIAEMEKGWIIFIVHDVATDSREEYDITPAELEEMISLSEKSGAEVVTVGEVMG